MNNANPMTPSVAMALARAQASAAGCRCRPDVVYRPAGMVEVAHEPDCLLANSGQSLVLAEGQGVPSVYDLTTAARLAVATGAVVVSLAEAVLVAMEGVEFPAIVAEYFQIERVTFEGHVVRVATMPNEMLGDVMGQVTP